MLLYFMLSKRLLLCDVKFSLMGGGNLRGHVLLPPAPCWAPGARATWRTSSVASGSAFQAMSLLDQKADSQPTPYIGRDGCSAAWCVRRRVEQREAVPSERPCFSSAAITKACGLSMAGDRAPRPSPLVLGQGRGVPATGTTPPALASSAARPTTTTQGLAG